MGSLKRQSVEMLKRSLASNLIRFNASGFIA